MLRSVVRWCSRIDIDGTPSRYYPRVRPRRVVMPVDPNDVHGAARHSNPLFQRYLARIRLHRHTQHRGAITLASVPAERSVADAFRVMLTTCERSGFFSAPHADDDDDDAHAQPTKCRLLDVSAALTPTHLQPLERAVRELSTALRAVPTSTAEATRTTTTKQTSSDDGADDEVAHVSPMYALALDAARDAASPHTTATPHGELTVRDVDRVWELLERTPLNAPVHGALAQRGKALVEYAVARMAYSMYPRLRSRHVQQLLHQTCGLLPCAEAATRLGLVDVAGVEADVSMWRELNVLTQRLHEARAQAEAHKERLEKGVVQQRRWYWRAAMRSARSRLRTFPVRASELQPRLEWLRSLLFAYVAFVHLASRSGGDVGGRRGVVMCAEALVHHVFCPTLARHLRERTLLERATAALDAATAAAVTVAAPPPPPTTTTSNDGGDAAERLRRVAALRAVVAAELTRAQMRTADEVDVLDAQTHPRNHAAALRRAQLSSSGGSHAVEPLHDDVFSDYHARRHRRQAPGVVVHALYTPHALKEAQLILRYAPHIAPSLRRAPLDVDQVVRRVTEVHETNRYTVTHHAQQFRAVDYTVCRLYSGTRCLGEGKGETLMQSMQEAAQHMVYNYYLQPRHATPPPLSQQQQHDDVDDDADERARATDDVAVRMRTPRTEEEVVF